MKDKTALSLVLICSCKLITPHRLQTWLSTEKETPLEERWVYQQEKLFTIFPLTMITTNFSVQPVILQSTVQCNL